MKGISIFEVLKKPSIAYHSPLEEAWYNAIEEFMKKLDQYKGYVNPSDVTDPQAGDWCINDEGVWVYDGTTWQQIKEELPIGIMCFWADDTSNLPSGWIVCDGNNGTPDVRDKFIIGASSSYSLLSTGGANSKTHSHDSFTIDSNITCTQTLSYYALITGGTGTGVQGADKVCSDMNHTHDIASNNSYTSNTPPPYRALYVIKYTGG